MLENCELGMGLMVEMEELLLKIKETTQPGFRLWLSALPDKDFPLGLLQMSTKVTNEPPSGLKAGIVRSYTLMVDQDKLERIDGKAEGIMWRKLLMCLCFLHSVVQERRKFGALGWCIPYEYNQGDQFACMTFLEKHLYLGPISWPTTRYMVCDVQYGGKITDSVDRRLFQVPRPHLRVRALSFVAPSFLSLLCFLRLITSLIIIMPFSRYVYSLLVLDTRDTPPLRYINILSPPLKQYNTNSTTRQNF